MREFLDTLIKADQCVQYENDIGLEGNTVIQLCANIRAVFEYIIKAGLKLSMSKCYFGILAQTGRRLYQNDNTRRGVSPSRHRQKRLENCKFFSKYTNKSTSKKVKKTPKAHRIPELFLKL